VHELFHVRDRSATDREAWSAAATELHARLAAHYGSLERIKQRIKVGDVEAAEDALTDLAARLRQLAERQPESPTGRAAATVARWATEQHWP